MTLCDILFTDKGQSVPFAHRLYVVGVPGGLIWVSARQGPKHAPHGVGGQHADMFPEPFALFNIQHPTSNSATLDFAHRIQLLRKLS
jgi:hypothetical protein